MHLRTKGGKGLAQACRCQQMLCYWPRPGHGGTCGGMSGAVGGCRHLREKGGEGLAQACGCQQMLGYSPRPGHGGMRAHERVSNTEGSSYCMHFGSLGRERGVRKHVGAHNVRLPTKARACKSVRAWEGEAAAAAGDACFGSLGREKGGAQACRRPLRAATDQGKGMQECACVGG
jgi:hypothetical protein